MKKFDILIRNYNIESKKYQFGTQIIKSLSNDEFIKLIDEIPKPDEEKPIQIEIVTEDLIIQKSDDGNLQYNYNRVFPFKIRQRFKGKLKLSELKDFNKKSKNLLKVIILSVIFFFFNFLMLEYFLLLYANVLSIFIEINFGTIIVRLFLLSSFLFPMLGIIIIVVEFINLMILKFSNPLVHENPSKYMIVKNSIIKATINFWQVIYLCVYVFVYVPNTDLQFNYDKFLLYLFFVLASFIIGLYFLIGNFILYNFNKARKKDILNFLYYEIQNPKISGNVQNYYIKTITDIESVKTIEFKITSILISIISIIITFLPNVFNF